MFKWNSVITNCSQMIAHLFTDSFYCYPIVIFSPSCTMVMQALPVRPGHIQQPGLRHVRDMPVIVLLYQRSNDMLCTAVNSIAMFPLTTIISSPFPSLLQCRHVGSSCSPGKYSSTIGATTNSTCKGNMSMLLTLFENCLAIKSSTSVDNMIHLDGHNLIGCFLSSYIVTIQAPAALPGNIPRLSGRRQYLHVREMRIYLVCAIVFSYFGGRYLIKSPVSFSSYIFSSYRHQLLTRDIFLGHWGFSM